VSITEYTACIVARVRLLHIHYLLWVTCAVVHAVSSSFIQS